MLKFEWDETKNKRNILQHGVDFADVVDFLDDPGLIERLDLREEYGEERIMAYANVAGRILAILFVERGAAIRLISARPASRDETDDYFKNNAI
jgi:uncharacterized DUF497 family protein